jgi:putative transposase
VSGKYVFIAAERAAHEAADATVGAPTDEEMTRWLDVSKAGFYEWDGRGPSGTEHRREELKLRKRCSSRSAAPNAYRHVHAELVRAGERVGDELVLKLMREMDLVAVQSKRYKRTTVPGEADPAVPHLVCRDFTAERPGVKLVGDITYIPTWQGWLYLATAIVCFSKEVIGWSMAEHMRTELVTDALDMAAREHVLDPGYVMHCDRGTQYTSAEYVTKLGDLGLQHLLGKTGICFDNALAEFFRELKERACVPDGVFDKKESGEEYLRGTSNRSAVAWSSQ